MSPNFDGLKRRHALFRSYPACFVLPFRGLGLPLNAMILRRASRTDPRFVLGSALAFVLPLGANLAAFAQDSSTPAAQAPSPSVVPAPAKPDLNTLKQHDQEL